MKSSSVQDYFSKLLVEYQVLSEGKFKLSSGEQSHFYYEFDKFNDGKSLNALGFTFLTAAKDLGIVYDVIYGKAYKGALIAIAMTSYAWQTDFCGRMSNSPPCVIERKEYSDKNTKSILVGASIKDRRVLLVDDVTTSLQSLNKSVDICFKHEAKSVAILVGVNRSSILNPVVSTIPVHYIIAHSEFLTQQDKWKRLLNVEV